MKTTTKLRVALFFGGVSSEHEVSCVSASAWLRALGQSPCAEQYEAFPVGITKDGRWLACSPTPEAMADGSWEQGDCTPCVLSPDRRDHGLWLLKDGRAELVRIDICAPVMHGKNGEDGTIQGLFELARIPYVGCGVLGSAVCMDKAVANALMDAAGVPHCRWAAASRADSVSPLIGVASSAARQSRNASPRVKVSVGVPPSGRPTARASRPGALHTKSPLPSFLSA